MIASVKTADSNRFKIYFSKGFHNLPGVFPGMRNAQDPEQRNRATAPGRKNEARALPRRYFVCDARSSSHWS